MGISFYLVWKKGLQKQEIKIGLFIFGIQLGLNCSMVFSLLWVKIPLLCLHGDYVALGCNLATILQFRKISKIAPYILFPYILWVSFAALLNYYLWILNS